MRQTCGIRAKRASSRLSYSGHYTLVLSLKGRHFNSICAICSLDLWPRAYAQRVELVELGFSMGLPAASPSMATWMASEWSGAAPKALSDLETTSTTSIMSTAWTQ